ncbi:hypothetical protein AVEN_67448-1 [Araneus ventricosus]|uniref:Uncharacterized protein n=1 Tax=Araneus ventricosus TaxID=182803 RepID=A0A4Y2KW43_ARAVE|nr:hypothetical protein AVEN_67448-1 [Araneus ventricosus]
MDIVSKAKETDELSKVIVRLDGFHLLMSYMGAEVEITGGRGLEEMQFELFSKNAVIHIANGHTYPPLENKMAKNMNISLNKFPPYLEKNLTHNFSVADSKCPAIKEVSPRNASSSDMTHREIGRWCWIYQSPTCRSASSFSASVSFAMWAFTQEHLDGKFLSSCLLELNSYFFYYAYLRSKVLPSDKPPPK